MCHLPNFKHVGNRIIINLKWIEYDNLFKLLIKENVKQIKFKKLKIKNSVLTIRARSKGLPK